MVVIALPSQTPTEVRHDLRGVPSISTVHAPHFPSPQPYLLPVSSRSSRRTLSKLRSPSAFSRRFAPLTRSSLTVAILHPHEVQATGAFSVLNPAVGREATCKFRS